MRLSVFRTAAVAASFLPSIFAAAAVPPVDGVQSIADSLGASAQSLSAQVGAIAAANAAFNASAGGSASVAPTVDLSGAISGAISTFWQTAFDVEKKVCTIVFTINPGTIAQAQASLIAGVQAQITAVSNIVGTLQATANTIKALITIFTAAEVAVIKQLILALVTAANASVEPLNALATGGASLGLGALATTVTDLQSSVSALVTLSGTFSAIIVQ